MRTHIVSIAAREICSGKRTHMVLIVAKLVYSGSSTYDRHYLPHTCSQFHYTYLRKCALVVQLVYSCTRQTVKLVYRVPGRPALLNLYILYKYVRLYVCICICIYMYEYVCIYMCLYVGRARKKYLTTRVFGSKIWVIPIYRCMLYIFKFVYNMNVYIYTHAHK